MFRAVILKRSRGFTFIELSLAVVVLAILVTLAAANWSVLRRSDKETFLERFSMEVALLREEAVSSYQQRAMELNITDGTIRIGAIDAVNGFDALRQIPLPDRYVLKNALVNGKRASVGRILIGFYPSGLVDRAILHFEAEKEGFSSIVIHPLTAKVELQSGYTEELTLEAGRNPS